ncbi:MAG: MBL fold metallo-hydrolase [Clostridia bacterium]|nr:MBL fold metallo-hydrolase [Clostridia bacterium]
MTVRRILLGELITNCYLLLFSDRTAVIDPGDCPEKILKFCGELPITDILLTHGHLDHTAAMGDLCDRFSPRVWMHEKDGAYLNDDALRAPASSPKPFWRYDYKATDFVDEDDVILLGEGDEEIKLQVLHTPGHTPGSLCFYLEEQGILFSGDTLFQSTCGRTDFPLGSPQDMKKSLRKLFDLPKDTAVYPGHGFATKIGNECRIAGDLI